ncbi:MAG: type III-A CRISPR-associated protein Csm2 [Candidatus Lokiarchaeota archaeon]|nr:type III-A CRISPR-associated protein Csm2 [Candidatus Lokiarchaeota archaeon]
MARNEYKVHQKVKDNTDDLLEGNGRLIVDVSEDIGKQTSGRYGVTTNQIRRIFGDLKRYQYREFDPDKIQLIRPKLAYTFSRHNRYQGIDLLLGTIDYLIDKVKTGDQFTNIVNLFESILAYHKKYGGK